MRFKHQLPRLPCGYGINSRNARHILILHHTQRRNQRCVLLQILSGSTTSDDSESAYTATNTRRANQHPRGEPTDPPNTHSNRSSRTDTMDDPSREALASHRTSSSLLQTPKNMHPQDRGVHWRGKQSQTLQRHSL